MQTYLDGLAGTIAEDEHVLLILDQAGWHVASDGTPSLLADARLVIEHQADALAPMCIGNRLQTFSEPP